MDTRSAGETGEKLVQKFYRRKGYKIIKTNYRLRIGEIDIIAGKGNLIVFIEVKTRQNDNFAPAYRAVTPSKQSKIKAAASVFLSEYGGDVYSRFDVAEVYDPDGEAKINIIENAFE